MLVVFLLQVSHGPYYVFYTLYLEDHGYRAGVIGSLWALGVATKSPRSWSWADGCITTGLSG